MEWRIVFWVVAIILIGSNFFYVGFGSGNLQKWNQPVRGVHDVEISNYNENDKQIKENPSV